LAFKPCEFRRFDSEWICDAAGAPLAAIAEPAESLEEACARCRIPEELARRPCLFMVPAKVRHGKEWRDLFPCHWYHSISREDTLRTTWLCGGCVDWFPRPPREINPRFLERTAAMREAMLRRLAEPPAPPPDASRWRPPPPRPWWRRLGQWATAWV
jgi:hypothetical protein